MVALWVIFVVSMLVMLLATAFLLGRYFSHRQLFQSSELSPVTQQHLAILQGGHLNEAAVATAKARFRSLLERGRIEEVEASFQPGTQYIIHVRALVELGTEEAGRILERQLAKRLTPDSLEQSWYWIDLANGLRLLNRSESLTQLLRTGQHVWDQPLGNHFAAPVICFLGFAGLLREDLRTREGRITLRLLQKAVEGACFGIPPQLVIESRLGELLETLWDHQEASQDPLVIRVYHEALRLLRRSSHAEETLKSEPAELEAYRWQISRLTMLESSFQDCLDNAGTVLVRQLPTKNEEQERETLETLKVLRAPTGEEYLQLVRSSQLTHVELGVDLLRWSQAPGVGDWLREWILRSVPLLKRSQRRPRPLPPRRRSFPEELPYAALLRALRGQGSKANEAVLLLASRDWNPTFRREAISSLGWWEPFQRQEVLMTLQEGRRDPNPEVRLAARAAS